ncbi:3'(2'),5'-bisphosphate nucleotidase CysQ [Winogradskyella sp. 3972H.M.0a.05]|uniref:3'(2'),5'-bisphosphate nucleotidase CysQ n=1 Tax=Winogradskyella sp. 3972H.M.0a.05 TaxID=2950277 RepID=UPI003398C426
MLNDNLELAIKAAIEAGQAIMDIYEAPFDVEYKEDDSPLTKADKESNTIINTYLKPTTIPIISEENKQIDFDIRKEWKTCWIVDPVDGTKEFIKRNGEFTVNIALVKEGNPLLGVIYVPATKELYYADVSNKLANKVVLENHVFNKENIVKASLPLEPRSNEDIIKVVGSRSHMNSETKDFVDTLKAKGSEVEIVSKGSSLKFCLVAEGKADIYPRYAPTMEWDTAAGQAICNAVGINVISKATNEQLTYNKENLLNPWFLVSN